MHEKTIRILGIAFFAAVLLWGIYTLLAYLGVPIHAAVLLTDAGRQMVSAACHAGDDASSIGSLLCRGTMSFGPFVLHTIARAAPFLWYIVGSVVVVLAAFMYQYFRDERWELTMAWTPWKVLCAALVCLWLMFTALSYGSQDGRPVRTYVEPTMQSYNVSQQGLAALQSDYTSMLNRGCLSLQGQAENGVKIYTLRTWCVQTSFVTRVLPQVLFLLVLFFEFLVAGRLLLQLFKLRTRTLFQEMLFSVATGAGVWIAVLWLAAALGMYVSALPWALAIAVPVIGYRHALFWGDRFLHRRWEVQYHWHSISLVLGWLLISYITLNFLTVVRPFPIGWDDLGSYLNRPRLLVSYGRFIPSMAPFEWGYLTSLGFLTFGYDSIIGATASMMVNWMAGLLAVLGVAGFAHAFLGKKAGVLSALLYYSLPLVGHFSFADMKIDNAVFFFGTMATLSLFLALFPQDETDAPIEQAPVPFMPDWKLVFFAGIMAALAFATKSTAIMVVMALGAVLLGAMLHWSAFLGSVFLAFMVFSWQGGFSIQGILQRATGAIPNQSLASTLLLVGLAIGLLGIVAGFVLSRHRLLALKLTGVFIGGFLLCIFPWVEHNNILNGTVIPHLEFGAPNYFSPRMSFYEEEPRIDPQGKVVRSLPKELQADKANPACTATGSKEELDRYWGFSNGWGHYLTLPWRTVMNIDSVGYYVTTIPALLLFPLLLLLPYFWSKRGRWLRWVFAGTIFLLLQWMFLANGVPWYGIGIFLGLVIGLEAMAVRAPDTLSRIAVSILLACSLLSAFAMRFWQFETQRNILEYSLGKVSAGVLEEITIPYYNDISDEVVRRHTEVEDRPYMYRVGTFIPYFIPKNLEMIGINDHQLDVFNCLYQERDAALTLKRLKALGFNSIIFDTNTATIEKDENGSLHAKVKLFTDFVNTPGIGLKILVNDPNAGVAFIEIP